MALLLTFITGSVGAGAVLAKLSARGSGKAVLRRLDAIKLRHGGGGIIEAQLKRITTARATRLDTNLSRLLPNPDLLKRRLDMTGKGWTLTQYAVATGGLTVALILLLLLKGVAALLAIFVGLAAGIGVPFWIVGRLGRKRALKFITRFPDAIELLVRGLRSGLPISETMGVVAAEVPDPVGTEFRGVNDKMKIGRTMEGALQDTADRLQTPEFQFFVISLAIQRETGGNLAETLSNLAEVLRKRMQMKLKIRAMSSESKASAYIIGALPFIVFGLISWINPEYMGGFFTDQRLIIAAVGAGIWMSIGVLIMAKMINFEI